MLLKKNSKINVVQNGEGNDSEGQTVQTQYTEKKGYSYNSEKNTHMPVSKQQSYRRLGLKKRKWNCEYQFYPRIASDISIKYLITLESFLQKKVIEEVDVLVVVGFIMKF